MRIETDNYLITQDDYQFIVQSKTTYEDSLLLQDKSKVGTVKLGKPLYYPRLEQCLNKAIELSLNSNHIESLEEVKQCVQDTLKEFKEATHS